MKQIIAKNFGNILITIIAVILIFNKEVDTAVFLLILYALYKHA